MTLEGWPSAVARFTSRPSLSRLVETKGSDPIDPAQELENVPDSGSGSENADTVFSANSLKCTAYSIAPFLQQNRGGTCWRARTLSCSCHWNWQAVNWTACRPKSMMTHRMLLRARCVILTGRTEPWLRYFPTTWPASITPAIVTTT